MISPYAPSYQCGHWLVAAGCPLDYLEHLPGKSSAHRERLYIRELSAYAESRLYELGPLDLAFVIGIRIGTDIPSGIVISCWDWKFDDRWDPPIDWDWEPRDVVPKSDHEAYAHLFKSRVSAVLNDRRLVAHGYPVQGLLCGRAFEPLPESFAHAQTVHATFRVTDDRSCSATLPITLTVHRRSASALKVRTAKRRGRLFDKPDLPVRSGPFVNTPKAVRSPQERTPCDNLHMSTRHGDILQAEK